MNNNETEQKSHRGAPTGGAGSAPSPTAHPDTKAPNVHPERKAAIPARQTEIEAAIKQLWRKLQIAAAAYDPSDADHGRVSSGFALIAVLEFLAVLFPQMPALPIPLEALLHALFDVDRGIRNPLLTPPNRRGRGPIPLADELFRAIVAAAMTKRLEDDETSLEMAARYVERRLGELGYRARRNIEHKQIAKWREKMMEGGIGQRGVERYRQALALVKQMKPVEGANFLLGNLAALHPGEFRRSRLSRS